MQVIDAGDLLKSLLHSIPWQAWVLFVVAIILKCLAATAPKRHGGKRNRRKSDYPIMPFAVLIALGLFFLKGKIHSFRVSVVLLFVIAVVILGIVTLIILYLRKSNARKVSLANNSQVDICGGMATRKNQDNAIVDLQMDNDWLLPHSEAERRGAIGEWQLLKLLKDSLPLGGDDGYRILHNVMLEDNNGVTTQIDFVVVSKYGVFIIEAKFYKAWIFANESSAQWIASYLGGEKHRFQNPLRQNYRHICVIAEKTGINRNLLIPIIAFGSEAEFKTKVPPGVMHYCDVPSYILSHEKVIIQTSQLNDIVEVFKEWNDDIEEYKKLAHTDELKKRHSCQQET